jgi:DNA repair exonuclease SbcCD ATPase subunit
MQTPRRDANTDRRNTPSTARRRRSSSNSLSGRLADLQRLQQENDDLKRELRQSQAETAAVEQRLRDYEGDVLLSRATVDSDADDQEAIEELRVQLARAEQADAESTRRLHESQADLKWMKDIAEALEVDLQQSREAQQKTLQAAELEAKVHQETIRRTTAELAKAAEELERWKALATVRDGLLSATQAQANTLSEDKQKLGYALACCQRWADKRLQELEKAREDLDADNCHLRATSTSIQEAIQRLERELDESDQSFLEEEAMYHEELERRAATIDELTARVAELEQQLESTAPASTFESPRVRGSPSIESASRYVKLQLLGLSEHRGC